MRDECLYGLNSAESFTKTKRVKWHNLEKEKAPQKKMFVLENVTLIDQFEINRKLNFEDGLSFLYYLKLVLIAIFLYTHVEVL